MESFHFILMIAIIAIIVCIQLHYFRKNRELLSAFRSIFPENAEQEWMIRRNEDVQIVSRLGTESLSKKKDLQGEEQKLSNTVQQRDNSIVYYEDEVKRGKPNENGEYSPEYYKAITRLATLREERSDAQKRLDEIREQLQSLDMLLQNCKAQEQDVKLTRTVIISSINKYLNKNKDSVTDFNLIKDIVDRNCDAKEEEIQTQTPIPLYLGLVGTMAGIIIGVLVLVVSGALNNMMTTFDASGLSESAAEVARKAFEAKATAGVQALLEGVGIAMLSSILGIILTTIGSLSTKNAKSDVEVKKHNFLSWMQAELLPKISTDVSAALVKLGKDLNGFNSTFSSNAQLLQDTIKSVTNATTQQTALLAAIQRLDIARVAQANISIYDNLRNCSAELHSFGENLLRIKTGIKEVSEELDAQISEYKQRETYIQDASSKVDIATSEAQKQLAESIGKSFEKYKELVDNLYLESENYTKESSANYRKELEKLHQTIVAKLGDMKKLEDEMKNLTGVKENIASLEKTTAKQSEKFDRLAQSISELAKVKAGMPSSGISTQGVFMPTWQKVVLLAIGIPTWAWLIVWTILSIIR